MDADPVSFSPSPVYYTERTTPTKEVQWNNFLSIHRTRGDLISKMVTRLVRHRFQAERQSDAAVH